MSASAPIFGFDHVSGRVQQLPVGPDWIRPDDLLPADGQIVAVLHTGWGKPAACVATYTSGDSQEWYAGGLSLQRVVGWLPLPPPEVPL